VRWILTQPPVARLDNRVLDAEAYVIFGLLLRIFRISDLFWLQIYAVRNWRKFWQQNCKNDNHIP